MKKTGVLILSILTFIISCKEQKKAETQQNNYITFFSGSVTITDSSGNSKEPEIKAEIHHLDEIKTRKQSLLTIQFSNGLIKVQENSEFTFNLEETENSQILNIDLKDGSVFSKLKKLSEDYQYQIRTPNSVAAVRGTQFWVRYDKEKKNTTISIGEGLVEITNTITNEILKIESGKTAEIYEDKIEITDTPELVKLFLKMLGVEQMLEDPAVHETAFFLAENRKKYEEKEQFYKNKIELLKLYEEIPPFINFVEKQSIKKQIDEFTLESTNFEKIHNRLMLYQKMKTMPPLKRLKALGTSRIQKFSMTDGSQLVGMIISQNTDTLYLDTGAGVIKLPKSDIVQRINME